jgi:hypothetical protein
MLLWFAGASVVLVWFAFRSPALDYRLVMLGSVLPLLDAFTGGPWVLHTLLASVVALAVVMLCTQRRRLARRRALGLPIGMFVHLVLDGVWTRTSVFWWPFFGVDFSGRLPEISRGALAFVLDVIGAGCLVWTYRRFGLDRPEARRRFLHTGQLPRDRVR